MATSERTCDSPLIAIQSPLDPLLPGGRLMLHPAFILVLALPVAQQPAKPPAFPAINPAQARLDHTLSGLGGPGFAIAVNEEAGMLAAGCEHGTIPYWHKDVALGIRT